MKKLSTDKQQHFQYWGRRHDDFCDYLIMVEFKQFTQVGEGKPLPVVDGKAEEPRFKFIFTGLKCSSQVSDFGSAEMKMRISRVLNLIEDGTFINDFTEDDYKDEKVKIYLDKDSKYWG